MSTHHRIVPEHLMTYGTQIYLPARYQLAIAKNVHKDIVERFLSSHKYTRVVAVGLHEYDVDYAPCEWHMFRDQLDISRIFVSDIASYFSVQMKPELAPLLNDEVVGMSMKSMIDELNDQHSMGPYRPSKTARTFFDYILFMYMILHFGLDDAQRVYFIRHFLDLCYNQSIQITTEDSETSDCYIKLGVIATSVLLLQADKGADIEIMKDAMLARDLEPAMTFLDSIDSFVVNYEERNWTSHMMYKIPDTSALALSVRDLRKWSDDMHYYREQQRDAGPFRWT